MLSLNLFVLKSATRTLNLLLEEPLSKSQSANHPKYINCLHWYYADADDDEGSVSGSTSYVTTSSLKIPPTTTDLSQRESSPQLRSMGPMQCAYHQQKYFIVPY